MNAFIYRLTVVHRRLDDEIRRELKHRVPNAMRLLRLKKLRLAVKDRLHHYGLAASRNRIGQRRLRDRSPTMASTGRLQ